MLRSRTRAGRTSDPSSAWAVATNEYLGALRGCAHINCLAKRSSESTSKVTGKQLRVLTCPGLQARRLRPDPILDSRRESTKSPCGGDAFTGPAPRFGRAARRHSDEILFFTLQESSLSSLQGPLSDFSNNSRSTDRMPISPASRQRGSSGSRAFLDF